MVRKAEGRQNASFSRSILQVDALRCVSALDGAG